MTIRARFRLGLVLSLAFANQRSLSAQQLLQQGTKDLATQVATKISKEQKKTVAVVPFRDLDGPPTIFGAFLAEELTTQLFDIPGIRVVERTLLDKLMTELKLNTSGAINPATAKQIGKIVGADALVTGTVTDLTSAIAVNCRLIDTETGDVFGAAQVRIVKDDDVKRLLVSRVGENGKTQAAEASATQSTRNDPSAPIQRAAADGFTFELRACRATAGGIVCDFIVTNEREDFKLRLDQDTRLFDGSGREFHASRLTIGNQDTFKFGGGVTVVAGVKTPARVIFENLGHEIDQISVLELKGFARTWYTARFKNVTIVR